MFVAGNFGTIVKLSANYFTLLHAPDWNLYQYRVDFSPEEDRTNVKKALFREAVKEVLPGYIFDGTVMYTSNRLSPDPYELFVKSQGRIVLPQHCSVLIDNYCFYFLQRKLMCGSPLGWWVM